MGHPSAPPVPSALRSLAAAPLLLIASVSIAFGFVDDSAVSALEIPLPLLPTAAQPADLQGLGDRGVGLSKTSGSLWHGRWDAIADRLDTLVPARFRLAPRTEDGAVIDAAVRSFLAEHADLFDAPATELRTQRSIQKGGVWWITYQQTRGGLPIVGARLDCRLNRDGDLLLLRNRLVGPFAVPSAILTEDEAVRRAARDIEAAGLAVRGTAAPIPGIDECGETAEVIVPVFVESTGRIEGRRAFRVRLDVAALAAARFRSYVDATDGRILGRTNEIPYLLAEGTVRGDQHPSTPTDPYERSPFRNLLVTIAGVGAAYTDAAGYFGVDFPDASARTATARLEGRYCNVNRQDGADAQIEGSAQPGSPLSLLFDDGSSAPAERDVYHHVNVAHDAIRAIEPAFTDLDYEMPAAVNIALACNAYWDGTGVNFYDEGGGCANTGEIADVIYHEYGHGVSQFVYAPASPSGAMGEGFSDYFAATITDQSKIGLGFTGPGTWLRDCENDRTWPALECSGEAHCLGEVIAGALWHMRANLITELGDHDLGVALADHLFHFARYGGNNDFEGYYNDLLAVDDDNGTLVDGTPHARSIIQAFNRHNIGPGFVLEILHTPPHDIDQPMTPIPLVAVFSSAVPLLADSLAVYYETEPAGGGPVTGPIRLQMAPTGATREYAATIPGQPLGTRVRYFLSGAASEMGLVAVDPPGAPTEKHAFLVAQDVVAPTIAHEMKTARSRHVWPVPVEAAATDNQSVASVNLEYRIDGIARAPVPLSPAGADLYQGRFGGSVAVGDLVEYRIQAIDNAATPNVSYVPPSGYISLPIVRDVADDMEHGVQDIAHAAGTPGLVDQWHLSAARNHTAGGSVCWKVGDTGSAHYADGADGVLEILPVGLGTGASLSFWHWIEAEEGGPGQAWDGALVEISTDAGSTWAPLVPVGGYSHAIIDNPASPFPAGYPVWSGGADWRLAQFDLSPYAGQLVRLRWRFGSDGYVGYEGWYVDDILLVPTTDDAAAVDPSAPLPVRTGGLGLSPNPFRGAASVRFDVAPGSGPILVTIHDVEGRRVRTLADGVRQPGGHRETWDGLGENEEPLAPGVYFVRLRWRGGSESRKLLLLR